MTPTAPAYTFTFGSNTHNVYRCNAGEGLPKHKHTFAHATVCNAGSCIIRKEGRKKIIDKNTQPIDLVANEWHEIEALEDNTVFINIFAN